MAWCAGHDAATVADHAPAALPASRNVPRVRDLHSVMARYARMRALPVLARRAAECRPLTTGHRNALAGSPLPTDVGRRHT